MNSAPFTSFDLMPAGSMRTYSDRVPTEISALRGEVGQATAAGGYIRLVNPAEWQPILAEACPGHDDAVVAFTTALGDMIVWEKGLFYLLRFRDGIVIVVGADATNFVTYVADARYLDWQFSWSAYAPAVERLGQPAFDECFGYVPLLALGGPERVENLQRVKMREHVLIISQLAGPLAFDPV
ncbi:hypothetical protein EDF39_2349 [Frondihabitans sp. PhB161]|nr:hypothetical protein EDF37_1900 [Frondihabitans sp. PhB153]RPF05642.1 hypothetical protein EDF39_2349 [Frondihabitans sp. PhB161]